MKEILRNVYIRNLELIMQPKFNSGNKNIWAVALLRYGGGMVRWTKNEHMDRETRKVMTKNKELHLASDTPRIYQSRKKGGDDLLPVRQRKTILVGM